MAGIYLHIPFCKTRCAYCDFFSSVSMKEKDKYVEALCEELNLRKDYLNGKPLKTIYFGGGTPSQLSYPDFQRIFDCIARLFPGDEIKEVTLEANPDDLSSDYLTSLRSLPFNRISLGIQSFNDTELHLLNRRHNARSAIGAVKNAQAAGFENISIDLIYGIPGQSLVLWENNLKQAVGLDIQHISAYHLTYEEGTPLFRLLKGGSICEIDEDLSLEQFSLMGKIFVN